MAYNQNLISAVACYNKIFKSEDDNFAHGCWDIKRCEGALSSKDEESLKDFIKNATTYYDGYINKMFTYLSTNCNGPVAKPFSLTTQSLFLNQNDALELHKALELHLQTTNRCAIVHRALFKEVPDLNSPIFERINDTVISMYCKQMTVSRWITSDLKLINLFIKNDYDIQGSFCWSLNTFEHYLDEQEANLEFLGLDHTTPLNVIPGE